MDDKLLEYIIYLPISILLTVWVATTLFRHGRRFLVDVFKKDEELADSVNHLLVVGFYLVNFGYVALQLRFGPAPSTGTGVVEALATKVGLVLVVLGVAHFTNLYVFTQMRKSRVPAVAFAGATRLSACPACGTASRGGSFCATCGTSLIVPSAASQPVSAAPAPQAPPAAQI